VTSARSSEERFGRAPISKEEELAVRIVAALNYRAYRDDVMNWEWELYGDQIGPVLFVLKQYKVQIL
jgi:hypothetical protein